MTVSETTDYIGNKIYENGTLKRILIDNGYIEENIYYFYIKDHLGNNRIVAKSNGTLVQATHYYPFGSSFAVGTGANVQPYKYNNKELDTMHGLNWYDYSARYKDDWRFTTVDPLAEKYYSWSPYVYCYNNPMKFIDPDGKQGVAAIPRAAYRTYQVSKLLRYGAVGGGVIAGGVYLSNPEVAKRAEEVGNNLISAAGITTTATVGAKTVMDSGVLEASPNPGYANQRKNDRAAKEGLDAVQAIIAKAIQDNMPDPSFDNGGGSDPKRPPQGTLSKIVAGVTAAAGVIQQLTNPDPSKDAHQAHLDSAAKKVNQQPQDPPREKSILENFIDWWKK